MAGCTTWAWSGPLKLINALKALIWYVYLEGTVFVSLGSTKWMSVLACVLQASCVFENGERMLLCLRYKTMRHT